MTHRTNRGGATRLSTWRRATSLALLVCASLLWRLMIAKANAALYFEPTTDALFRAARVQTQVILSATGYVLVTSLLSTAARRVELLLLAAPALLILACEVVSRDSAAAIIAIASTPFAIGGCLTVIALRRVRGPTPAKRPRSGPG